MPRGKSPAKDEERNFPNEGEPVKRPSRRLITLYDAVAGRVNSHGFIPSEPYASRYRDTASSTTVPVRPEEVLFRRKHAPTRYEETDFYFANELLSPDCPLPSSDLLEAVHTFSADFYDQTTADRGRSVYQTMDETALIAMGILLEEMAKESLGETGDMVLVEGEEIPTDEDEPASRLGRRLRQRNRAKAGRSGIQASSGDDLERVVKKRRQSKKRRLARRQASTTGLETEAEEKGQVTW